MNYNFNLTPLIILCSVLHWNLIVAQEQHNLFKFTWAHQDNFPLASLWFLVKGNKFNTLFHFSICCRETVSGLFVCYSWLCLVQLRSNLHQLVLQISQKKKKKVLQPQKTQIESDNIEKTTIQYCKTLLAKTQMKYKKYIKQNMHPAPSESKHNYTVTADQYTKFTFKRQVKQVWSYKQLNLILKIRLIQWFWFCNIQGTAFMNTGRKQKVIFYISIS